VDIELHYDPPEVPMIDDARAFVIEREAGLQDEVHWVPTLRGKVLLAEDGPHNQRLIGALVEATGARLTIVDHGEAALEAALEGDHDLVLMDIQMPVMDGMTATRLLRAACYAGPVVALTANVMRADLEKYRKAGCTDALGKPIDRRRLYNVLARYLRSGDDGGDAIAEQTEDKMNAVLQRLAVEFRAELPARIASIEQALARRDWQGLRSQVHTLKGVAGSVGFPELTRLAQPVEASIAAARHTEAELQCAMLLEAARLGLKEPA
jgi:CheY-like chemotaxis protein/HPt (histidine-containing phosphotransfer) domain-containing protein